MTEDEITNQSIGLRDAIMRLCNEADTRKIALGAIIMAYCNMAESMGLSPRKACEIMITSIDDLTRT